MAELQGLDVERGVVVAYGSMIRAVVLDQLSMLNVHFSLLPRWRRAAPVERAILAGDVMTGVSVMSLEVELDTGPVHLERHVEIGDKGASELTAQLAQLGASALVDVLASPELLAHPTAQVGEVTYAQKLTKETFHIVPSMDLDTMLRTVRLNRAYVFVNGRRLRVLRAHRIELPRRAAGSLHVENVTVALVGEHGSVMLDEVQPEGSRPMTASMWWAGARLESADAVWS